MEINVVKLKECVRDYSSKITKYEECILNIYNLFNQVSSSWKGAYANSFIENIESQKKEIKDIISILGNIRDLYKYIVDSYESFGNKIYCDTNKKNSSDSEINKVIYDLNKLQLTLNNCPINDSSFMEKNIRNRNNVVATKRDANATKNSINKMFNKTLEIEKNVGYKISKINVNYISQIDMDEFI